MSVPSVQLGDLCRQVSKVNRLTVLRDQALEDLQPMLAAVQRHVTHELVGARARDGVSRTPRRSVGRPKAKSGSAQRSGQPAAPPPVVVPEAAAGAHAGSGPDVPDAVPDAGAGSGACASTPDVAPAAATAVAGAVTCTGAGVAPHTPTSLADDDSPSNKIPWSPSDSYVPSPPGMTRPSE